MTRFLLLPLLALTSCATTLAPLSLVGLRELEQQFQRSRVEIIVLHQDVKIPGGDPEARSAAYVRAIEACQQLAATYNAQAAMQNAEALAAAQLPVTLDPTLCFPGVSE